MAYKGEDQPGTTMRISILTKSYLCDCFPFKVANSLHR